MKAKKYLLVYLAVLVLIILFVVVRGSVQESEEQEDFESVKPFSVVLTGQSGGIALFSPIDEYYRVELSVPDASVNTKAYIVGGACGQLGERIHDLGDFSEGKSVIDLELNLSETQELTLAVYSGNDLISCGRLPQQ